MLRRLLLPALLAAVLAVFTAAAPASAEAPADGDVAASLSADPVYVDDGIDDDVFAEAELDALRSTAESLETPTYFLYLPDGAFGSVVASTGFLSDVADEVGPGNYAMFVGSQNFVTYSSELSDRELNRAESAARTGQQNQVDAMVTFGTEADELATAPPVSASGVVLLGILALLVAGGGFFLYNSKKKRDEQAARELAEIRQMAQEDVTRLGEDVARLEIDLSKVDETTRTDYERAMDAYDQAKSLLETIQSADQIRLVTNALEDGRYYMAATRARLNGDPVPERRGPCFFNPQHGPSAEDVTWAPPGGTPRSVTACSTCAQAVRTGGRPDVRMVEVEGERRPYYEAGPAYAPYASGYFGMNMMMGMFTGMMMGSMMGSMMGAGMMGAGMGDAGEGDFGGGDFGDAGGDFGGGDFGGFDF